MTPFLSRIIKMLCCLAVLWLLFGLNQYSYKRQDGKSGKVLYRVSCVLIVLFIIAVIIGRFRW